MKVKDLVSPGLEASADEIGSGAKGRPHFLLVISFFFSISYFRIKEKRNKRKCVGVCPDPASRPQPPAVAKLRLKDKMIDGQSLIIDQT